MEHEKRASVELMHERYEYWENVPKPGLFIDLLLLHYKNNWIV